jgi:superfamily II DNA/RNA helicase
MYLHYVIIICFKYSYEGFTCDSLHGDKAQNLRTRVLDRFRSGNIRVLVATDVAGRGLDVKVREFLFC